VTAQTGDRQVQMRVFGLTGALSVAQSDDWNGRLTINILSVPAQAKVGYLFYSGITEVLIDYSQYHNDAQTSNEQVDRMSVTQGIPMIFLAPAAVFGSGGEYSDIYSESGSNLLNSAIDQIVELFGPVELVLVGQSAGGMMVANLLPKRNDIRCAVISSAPLDLVAHEQFSHAHSQFLGSASPMNPIEQIASIPHIEQRHIYIGYSLTDQIVNSSYQIEYAERLAEHGHAVTLESAPPADMWGHDIVGWRYNQMFECAGRNNRRTSPSALSD